jgi:hypothetical protein
MRSFFQTGATLVEAVIAVGVLAVAVPLVFGAIAEAGKSGFSSEAETRSTWTVHACMEEIRASREGRPLFFEATTPGQAIPPIGEVWSLAFSAAGKPVGRLTTALHQQGAKELGGIPIRYIAVISAQPGAGNLMQTRISIEYPASAPEKKRSKLDFYTRIP